MIAALLIWIYSAVLFYLYGVGAMVLLRRWLSQPASQHVDWAITILFGMGLVTTLATVLSLFIPLGVSAVVILLGPAIATVACGYGRPKRKLRLPAGREWWTVLIVLLAFVLCLESGTRSPANPDTNSYHAQTIRWIETFAAVPGLGNLSGRLAYNSSWLLLNAAFSFSFMGLRSFHVMGSALFLAAIWRFASGLNRSEWGKTTLAHWMRLMLIGAAFWVLPGELSSPGTDLPAILLAWILLERVVELESSPGEDPTAVIALAAIPAAMMVLKLSSAPLMLVSVYLLVRMWRLGQRRTCASIVLVLALMLLPWMARSVMLSGYVVYPYPQVDLFGVDWKVPAANVDAVRNGILGWARLPEANWVAALQLPFQVWMPEWLRQRSANQLSVLALALLSPFGLLPSRHRRFTPFILTAYAAMLIWLLGAPNWRFGYGVVLGLVSFLLGAYLDLAAGRLGARAGGLVMRGAPVLITAFVAMMVVKTFDTTGLAERAILPRDYYPSRAEACSVDSLHLYCASVNLQCSYFAFPCVPGVPQGVRARGDSLQDGFYSTELGLQDR